MSNALSQPPRFLDGPGGAKIAYHHTPGKTPGVVFLGGFMSDMSGTKAVHLEQFCRHRGQAYTRFDYSGHGESDGRFADGTIGRWRDDALRVIDQVCDGPQILVGSSMGGWIMLLAACARPARVAGMIGIAAAPDFTEDLMWQRFSTGEKEALLAQGRLEQPSDYGEDPYVITLELIEDGRKHLLLRDRIEYDGPAHFLHGMADPDVPWQLSLRAAEHLTSRAVTVGLIKDGDHRLSRPEDLARLEAALADMTVRAGGLG